MSAEASPDSKQDDVFFCPACGQKHRGDLTPARKGGTVRAKCVGCSQPLAVTIVDGVIVAKVVETTKVPADAAPSGPIKASTPKVATEAPKAAAAPKATPATSTKSAPGKPSEERAPSPVSKKKSKDKEDDAPQAPAIVAEFPTGTKIGRYVLEEPIGEGGTGTVYRAFDATTNRYVAVKFLGKDQSESMRQRFLREIEVQANLRHQNLMPVFDRGEHEGRPYFAMELLYRPFTLTQIVEMGRGGTLSRYATLRPLEEIERLVEDVLLPVCEGIQIANVENGVIHRDLKPDNVLIDSRTLRAYVIDFGICHVLEKKNNLSTTVIQPTAEEAGIVGTPRFLAPEQARGTAHERTDVWGLGAILHFCLTGEAPIAAATPITRAELRRRIDALSEAEKTARAIGDETKAELCADKLSRLEDVGLRTLDDLFKDAREGIYVALPSTVPPGLASIVRKAMAPKTAERYVNPRSMASDLEAWLAGARTRAQAQEGPTAAGVVDTAKRAVRRYLSAGILTLAALAAGWLLGSMIGGSKGGLGGASRGDSAISLLDRLETRVDTAGLEAASMTVAEGARRYDALTSEYADAMTFSTGLGAADAERFEKKSKYVRDKFAPVRAQVKGPGGTGTGVLEDLTRSKRMDNVSVTEFPLAPGQYRLTMGKSATVAIPFTVPFIVRDGGRAADREPIRFTIVVPIAADAIPADWSLVIPGGDAVDHRGPPFSASLAIPMPVKPFLLEKYETTNAMYLAFLEGLPLAEDRKSRMPPVDFLPDADRPGHLTLSPAAKEHPVRGVTPDDATFFAKWRESKEGGTFRLPNEAEWAVAAGALLKFDLPGGVRGSPEDGDFVEPVEVRLVKDTSPYGVRGLLGNVREIVTGVRVAANSPEAFLTKGGGPGDPPMEAAIRRVRPLAHDARDLKAGLRLARDLPTEPTK